MRNKASVGTENHLIVQSREEAAKPVPESKTQEEKESREINLINPLNPGDSGFAAGGPLPPSPLPLVNPEIGPIEATDSPCMMKDGSPPQRLIRALKLTRKHFYLEQGTSL